MDECEPPKINILMVDDNESNLLALESILQAPERNLVRASSGDEALRYLLDCDVAVILLDVYMPGIDGLETAALIRGREKSRNIPIIFLTADNSGSAHLSRGYSLGAVDYILKPVEPDILRSKVAVFVELFKKTEEIKRQAALLHEKNIELESTNLERLSMLVELGQQLAAERDPLELLQTFCHSARAIIRARYAAIGILEEDGRTVRHFLISGFDVEPEVSTRLQYISHDKLGSMLDQRRPLRFSRDGTAIPPSINFLPVERQVNSLMVAPVISATHDFGWLYLADKLNEIEFSEADERLAVTLTAQVAVAYENARLYTEARLHAAELKQEVTERKQAEEERAQLLVREQAARSEAEAANRTKDEFLATLSHELRTPLTSILGWTHLLRSGNLPPDSTESALETIERNAKAQSQLIDDLLDVSRIITGNIRIEVGPVEVSSIIEAAINSVRPAALAKNIEVQLNLDPATGPVLGDASRLQQIVWNLFSNAVKFTPAGGRVGVSLGRTDSLVEIIVEDTGRGIPAEFLPHVFDRFRQADGTTTRTQGGLGLGLAIARHLVELHGGSIHAESPGDGGGTTFTVNLPAVGSQSEAHSAEEVSIPYDDGSFTPEYFNLLDGLRVLVVDDERDTREFIAFVLSQKGAEVCTSRNASEALSLLEGWVPDVLVSDIGMPGADGYEFIEKVRGLQIGKEDHLPAIALTAYAGVEDRTRALTAGYQVHLAKPVNPRELVTIVKSLAGQTKPKP